KVVRNEAATLGFWANKNGQKLLKTYGSEIGNWLASNFPNLFGNLNGATGTQVAAYFLLVKNNVGTLNGVLFAHAMTPARAGWVTGPGFGTGQPAKYGFQQGFGGLGLLDIYYNVGNNGASFGVANNTYQTVGYLLSYLNAHTVVNFAGDFTHLRQV